jgi:hypothetical protein
VYSRASILLLDDVLSAGTLSRYLILIIYLPQLIVDAHTAHHLYHECIKGELMQGRTIILVSHHLQLCAPGSNYIIALDNGSVLFEGSKEGFYSSGIMKTLVHSAESSVEMDDNLKEGKVTSEKGEETGLAEEPNSPSEASSNTVAPSKTPASKADKKPARKLMEEEKRAVGRVARAVWETYIRACGNVWYWSILIAFLIIVATSPVLENGWLKYDDIPIALTSC